MTKEEINEGNELISDFYGDISGITSYPNEPLEFHSSWDWLMPVVEKIGLVYYKEKRDIRDILDLIRNRYLLYYPHEVEWNDFSDITGVYRAVIQFIKWYNTNNIKN